MNNPNLEKGIASLINISMRMEKSLATLANQKSIDGSSNIKGSATGGIMGSIAGGIGNLLNTVTAKKLDKEQGKTLITVLKGVTEVINKTNIDKAKAFAESMKYTSSGIITLSELVSIKNIIKFYIGSKMLSKSLSSFIETIQGIYKTVLNPKRLIEQGHAVKSMSEGLKAMSSLAGKFILFAIGAPLIIIGATVMRLVLGIFTYAGESYRKIAGGGRALSAMGRGLSSFSVGLGVFMLLHAIAGTARIIGATLLLTAVAGFFMLIGSESRKIYRGGRAIKEMGLGLIYFSGALALMALTIHLIKPEMVVKQLGILGMFAISFFLLGKAAPFIQKGAKAAVWISIGIASIGLSLFIFDLAIKKIGLEEAGKSMIIAGIFTALAYGFAYMGKYSRDIIKGALAAIGISIGIAAIGIGLLIFTYALDKIKNIVGGDIQNTAITFGLVFGGIITAFSLLGLAAPLVTPGIAVSIGLGVALAALGLGLLVFSLSIKGISALGGIEKDGTLKGQSMIFGILKLFSSIALESILAIPGTVVAIAMGVALLSMSIGLIAFGAVSKTLDKMGALDSNNKLKATYVISDLISMFASVALDSIFAVPGIAVTLAMGLSLLSIAWGLSKASEVFSGLKMVGDKFVIADQLDIVISSLFNTFKNVSDLTAGSNISSFPGGAFIKNLTGTDPITMGIKTVSGIGEAIGSIASGIAAFSDLQEFKTSSGKTMSLVTAATNISSAVTLIFNSMKDSLISVGNAAGGKDWVDSLKNLIGQDPISIGLRVLTELGSALKGVVGGISAFSNFDKFPTEIIDKDGNKKFGVVDLWKVAESFKTNLPKLFGFLSEGFTALKLEAFDDDDKLELMDKVASGFSNLFTSISKINAIVIDPKKLDSLRSLGDIVKGLTESGKGFTSFVNPFMRFANAFAKFTSYIPMYGNNIKSVSFFGDQMTKFALHGNGMYNFARGFHTVALKMSDFAINFKKMDKDTINSFKSWTETFDQFLKVDTKKFVGLVKQVNDFYEPINKSFEVTRNEEPSKKQNFSQQYEVFKPTVKYPPKQEAPIVNIDLNPLIAQIAGLQKEMQLLNSKFINGFNGGILTTDR